MFLTSLIELENVRQLQLSISLSTIIVKIILPQKIIASARRHLHQTILTKKSYRLDNFHGVRFFFFFLKMQVELSVLEIVALLSEESTIK